MGQQWEDAVSAATHLHTYHCSNCRMFGTVGFKAPAGDHYKCPFCARWLAYKWSEPIKTQRDRDLAARGLTMNPGIFSEPPSTKRRCETCGKYVEQDTMVRLQFSRFCSQACADIEEQKIAATV